LYLSHAKKYSINFFQVSQFLGSPEKLKMGLLRCLPLTTAKQAFNFIVNIKKKLLIASEG